MDPTYLIEDTSKLLSPGLLFYKEIIRRNIIGSIEIAGSPTRLRPHVKTHKTREIVLMELEAGITKHKCATLAEAEMLATCGASDILIAYNLVGPNCGRMANLIRNFPKSKFLAVADHPAAARMLSDAMVAQMQQVDVLLDIDPGQHRTGITPGPRALELYESFAQLPGLRPGGIHFYDGHNHQEDPSERATAVRNQFEPVLSMLTDFKKKGLPVPRLVLGGTPTFPIYARMDLPGIECAPGTCFLQDHGYGTHFPDMNVFKPAALMLTRVISRPTPDRVTLDLGYKAVASDPPAGKRCVLLNVPDYQTVLQNEEHLVIETPAAERLLPGAVVYALPEHICPTCALHRHAYVIEAGRVTGQWEIVARDRMLSI